MSGIPEREESLFADALEHPPEERRAFLAKACGADVNLLARLVTLLAEHDAPMPVLAATPASLAGFREERPGDRIGRYKLLQKIGEGGCGIVWMAEQEEPVRRRVALKVIKLGMDTKAVVARFEAERQALAMMDHPNIAKVHDAGATASGRPFFVMELVRGLPITKHCDEHRLTAAARLELFVKLCLAVQHAHQKGIIHRDLKPSNVLVTINDGAPTPKIIDFGIAKATQGRLTDATLFTAFEQFIGTPAYMSPEQAEMSSVDIDTRTDIYSLGVLLYELLTGKLPFDPKAFARAGVEAIRHHIRDDEPPRPSLRWSTLGESERTTLARLRGTAPAQLSVILRGDLDWIVMRCLEKDRTRRYDTAGGIAADIERSLRNEPIIARPPSTRYLLRKLIRRHRLGFAAGVGVLGAIMIGTVTSAWLAVRAVRAEREQFALRQAAQDARAREAGLRARAEAQELIARQRAYAADMLSAQDALAIDNVERARELLQWHTPAHGRRDLRNWEWRYLWQRAQAAASDVLDKVPAYLWSLACSKDGRWLAAGRYWYSGELGGIVTVWNLPRREKFELQIGDECSLVAFAPNAPLLAIAGRNSSTRQVDARRSWVELWDVPAHRMQRRLELDGRCAALAFSRDGRILVTATFDDRSEPSKRFPIVTHWRVADGSRLREPYRAPQTSRLADSEYRFAISADLRFAAYPAEDEVVLIDLDTGRELWRRPSGIPTALAFSPDARVLASGNYSPRGPIRLWDTASGNELGTLEGNRGPVLALVFFSNGTTLASGCADRTIRLWDVPSRRELRTIAGAQSSIEELELLEGERWLVSSERSGTLRLWNLMTRPEPPAVSTVIKDVLAWRFASDSRSVFTSEADGSVAEWSVPGVERKRHIRFELPEALRAALRREWPVVVFARERPLVACGSREGRVWVFDFERGVLVAEVQTQSGLACPTAFFNHDNRLLIYQGDVSPPVYHEWDLARGFEVATWPCPEPHQWTHFLATPDDMHALMLRRHDGSGLVRNVAAGTARPIQLPIQYIARAAFSADGHLLAATSMEGSGKIWRYPELEEVVTLSGSPYPLHAVAFSADGSRVVTGSIGGEVARIWDVGSGQPVLVFTGPSGPFNGAAFSPDGTTLGANSGQLHLWHAPSPQAIAAAENAERAKFNRR